jgi:hypothetical protein
VKPSDLLPKELTLLLREAVRPAPERADLVASVKPSDLLPKELTLLLREVDNRFPQEWFFRLRLGREFGESAG